MKRSKITMIPAAPENIKKFSGKRLLKGADPYISRAYGDRLLGSKYQFRFDYPSKVLYLVIHQSGKVLYSRGRTVPIGTVRNGVFSLDLLILDPSVKETVSINCVCQLINSNIESLQAKAISFIESLKGLDPPVPRKIPAGAKAAKEKQARRARRVLKGIEIR